MLVHDDYSGESFYTESEQYQRPLLTRREQRELYQAWRRYRFIEWLMQPYLPDGILTFRSIDSKQLDITAWLEEEQECIDADRKQLQERNLET